MLRGSGLRAAQSDLSAASPYCRLIVGAQAHQTSVAKQGGGNPSFREAFAFDISSERVLSLEVMDRRQDGGGDALIGVAECQIMDWIAQGKFEGDVEVANKGGRAAGKLRLAARFERPGAMRRQRAAAGAAPEKAASAAPGAGPTGPGRAAAPQRDPSGKFTDREIWEAFVAFDLDRNNFVGAAEIRHVLANIGERVTDEEVDEMIRMCDRDGDGQVSFPDFFGMVTGGRKPPAGLGVAAGSAGAAAWQAAGAPAPPTGPRIVQARSNKRKALSAFAQENSIKPDSIRKAHRRLQRVDKGGRGGVDLAALCEVLAVEPSPASERAFKLFDYEGSGSIDAREFLVAVANFSGAGKDDKLKFAFMLFDEDGSGAISRKALTTILRANHMASSDAEVARKAQTIMSQADRNGDGVIAFEEFVVVSRKFPNVLFPSFHAYS